MTLVDMNAGGVSDEDRQQKVVDKEEYKGRNDEGLLDGHKVFEFPRFGNAVPLGFVGLITLVGFAHAVSSPEDAAIARPPVHLTESRLPREVGLKFPRDCDTDARGRTVRKEPTHQAATKQSLWTVLPGQCYGFGYSGDEQGNSRSANETYRLDAVAGRSSLHYAGCRSVLPAAANLRGDPSCA